MAKLSAHGNELARMEKAITLSEGVVCTDTKAFMEDGAVLQKSKYARPDGSHWNTGWKLVVKASATRLLSTWTLARQQEGWVRA